MRRFFYSDRFVISLSVKCSGIVNNYRMKWMVDLRVDLHESLVLVKKPNLKNKSMFTICFFYSNTLKLPSAHNRITLCQQLSVGHFSAYLCNLLHGAMIQNRFYEVSAYGSVCI